MTFDDARFTGLILCRTCLLAGAGFWDAMFVATASTTTQIVRFYNLIYGASRLRGHFFLCDGLMHSTPTFRVSQTFVLGHTELPQMPQHGWCFPQGSLMNRPLLINLLGERHLLCLWSADLWYRYQIGRDCKWDMWNHNPVLYLWGGRRIVELIHLVLEKLRQKIIYEPWGLIFVLLVPLACPWVYLVPQRKIWGMYL